MTQTVLRALVLEDEWAARNYLVELLEGSGLACVVAACADTVQAEAALNEGGRSPLAFDVAFVDIRLAGEPRMDAGVGWIRSVVAAHDGECPFQFVLTTASREHALEAYQLGVADYLVKPFTNDRVLSCLRRVALSMPPRHAPVSEPPRRVVARDGKNLVFVSVDDVCAFEAAEGLSYVYLAGARYEVDLSLSALASSLGPEFVRVHRNWLVPLGAVRTLERDSGESRLVLSGGDLRVPVARDRVTAVRDALLSSAVGLRKIQG